MGLHRADPLGAADANAPLLALLLREGVLHRSERQQIVDVDGQSARWMLDSLGFSLTRPGARLAARALLRLLERFEGRQLATYGTIGIPLLQAVVLESKGRYRGLLVRKEVKTYGSRRRIEGRVDPKEPVVLLDDSISSGFSMEQGAHHLLEAGLELEGGVCLVRFGYDGVAHLEQTLGVPFLSVFDVERDLSPRLPGEPVQPANASKVFPELRWATRRLADGLDPCVAARQVIAHWLQTHTALRPPRRFDLDAPHEGGVFVSLRRRDDIHDRPARMGFWHLPGERSWGRGEDLVRASVQTAHALEEKVRQPAKVLARCGVGVTFFSRLEEVPLSRVDDRVHGIVVQSAQRPWVLGGGLPRMPGLRNAWELFRHAAYNNAQLHPTEPYRIYRHGVFKRTEEGVQWQGSGVPLEVGRWPEEHPACARPLLERAREEVLACFGLAPRPAAPLPLWPEGVEQVFLSVFRGGHLLGCMGTDGGAGAPTLRDLARAASHDPRFARRDAGEVAVGLSFLREGLDIGEADPEWLARVTRHGEQALEARQDEASALLLPAVVTYQDLSRLDFPHAVLEKAGIRAAPYEWRRYDVTSWLLGPGGLQRLEGALPRGAPPRTLAEAASRLRPLLEGFLARTHTAKGEPYVRYLPFHDVLKTDTVPPWLAHRAYTQARLGLAREAREDLARFRVVKQHGATWLRLGREEPGLAELAFAALTWCELGQPKRAAPLCRTLLSRIGPTGRFSGPEGVWQDYAPYQALLALAVAAHLGAVEHADALERAFAHYRRRFRGNRSWGAFAWAAQAFAARGVSRREPEWVALCFEAVDAGLESQSAHDGCFYTPNEGEAPSALTAVYLEGVAAARWAARATRDARRARRYEQSLERGLRFLDALVYQPRDADVLPNFEWARGGLRSSPVQSEVRLDYVQHALGVFATLERGLLPRGRR